jgi:micrococcal nuclease
MSFCRITGSKKKGGAFPVGQGMPLGIFKSWLPSFFLFLCLAPVISSGSAFKLSPESDISFPPDSRKDEALVIAVYDGDTLKVRFASGRTERVRLIGVNAPETDHPQDQVRLWAYLSKRFAFCHLYNRKVCLSYDWQRKDQYGRILAYVWTDCRELFNAEIIERGFASAFLKYPFDEVLRKKFADAEKAARAGERGLWKSPPFEGIPYLHAGMFVDRMGAVEFICRSVRIRRDFVFFDSPDGVFSALIPAERLALFQDPRLYQGRRLRVWGYVESFREQPQIMLFFPEQIDWIDEVSHLFYKPLRIQRR